jgi:hypothetical protein
MRAALFAIILAPLLAATSACSEKTSAPPAGARSGASASALPSGAAPGSAALPSPEENYAAAAAKIACLAFKVDDAETFAKKRAKLLSDHGYSDESWIADSKQHGASKGDAIVSATEAQCPF